MDFLKFTILAEKDHQSFDGEEETILVNSDHIVSLKPIQMVVDETLIQGLWLRLSNGKKYRVIKAPSEITQKLGLELGSKDS